MSRGDQKRYPALIAVDRSNAEVSAELHAKWSVLNPLPAVPVVPAPENEGTFDFLFCGQYIDVY